MAARLSSTRASWAGERSAATTSAPAASRAKALSPAEAIESIRRPGAGASAEHSTSASSHTLA